MSSLDATYLAYVALALPLVGAASWSVYRHSAPLLFELVDADEMAVAGIHRLVTAGHVLIGAAAAVYLAPSDGSRPLLTSVGGLLVVLAALHLGVLALFFAAKARLAARAFRSSVRATPWVPPPRTVLIPGATPPTVPMPPPVFHAPRGVVPPGVPAGRFAPPPAWTSPPPAGPQLRPPYPPPWCAPVSSMDNVWAPPRR